MNLGDVMNKELIEEIILWIINKGTKLVIGIIVLFIVFKIINLLSSSVRKTLEKKKIDLLIAKIIYSLVRKGLKIGTFIIFLGYVGIDTAGIGAAIASIFVGVGLALQGSLSNLAGGVILLVLRPFNIDDFIETKEYSGTVESIGIFYTCLRTPDNKVIYVPNGELANNEIVNYSKKNVRRMDKIISISYDSDLNKAKEIIKKVCEKNEIILNDPKPFIKVYEYADSSIKLLCRVWTKSTDYFSIFFDLLDDIKFEFDKNNIHIPYPKLDVNIYNKD